MATVSASFTGTTAGGVLSVKHLDKITYTVSGTFVGTWVLERSQDNGISYEAMVSGTGSATALPHEVITKNSQPADYRFRCSAFTSGTIVTSFSDATSPIVSELKDSNGNVVLQITEGGVIVPGTIAVTGTSAFTGAVTMAGGSNGSQSTDIASATTTDLDSATGNLVDVTGTTTITGITLSQGRMRTVRFTGALVLTNGASLVLPGAINITTVAGDYAIFAGYASGVVRCVLYQPGGKMATLAKAETLSSKTLSSPVINTPTINNPLNITVSSGQKTRWTGWAPPTLTSGTSTTPGATTVYVSQIYIPSGCTLTGIGVSNGATVGTNKYIVALFDSTGTLGRSSDLAGTTITGADVYQEINFTSTYAANGPGVYWIGLYVNGTTDRFRSIPSVGAFAGLAGSVTGQTFGTIASLTLPSTFTADKGPVAYFF